MPLLLPDCDDILVKLFIHILEFLSLNHTRGTIELFVVAFHIPSRQMLGQYFDKVTATSFIFLFLSTLFPLPVLSLVWLNYLALPPTSPHPGHFNSNALLLVSLIASVLSYMSTPL
jgi:hypothetical protein